VVEVRKSITGNILNGLNLYMLDALHRRNLGFDLAVKEVMVTHSSNCGPPSD